jgi:hypothetical protein
LKKQSQFENGRIDVKSFMGKDYIDTPRFEGLKNKANQSQFAVFGRPFWIPARARGNKGQMTARGRKLLKFP